MIWQVTHRANVPARKLADRHYNRQKVGASQFVPPGRACVLYARSKTGRAVWVTSWPFAKYVKHAWPGAWINSLFRNEGAGLSSDLIRQAIAVSRWFYENTESWVIDPIPDMGIITFVDPRIVKGFFRRSSSGKELMWGYSYINAGFKYAGWSKGGLMALQMLPSDMPSSAPPVNAHPELFEIAS